MGNFFVKKNKDIKLIGFDVNVQQINPEKSITNYLKTNEEIGKFIPNDELYRRYNNFTLKIRDIPKYEHEIKNNLEKIERYQEIVNEETNGDMIKELGKHETLIEIEKLKSKNKYLETKIKEAKDSDQTVMTEWLEYNKQLQKLIDDNNLTSEITITNLYCSVNLATYIRLKINDTIYVNKSDEIYQTLGKISQVINIKHLLEEQKINKDKLTIALNNYKAITNVMEPEQKQYEQVLEYMPKEDPNYIKLDDQSIQNAVESVKAYNEERNNNEILVIKSD